MRVETTDPEVRRLVEVIASTVEAGGGYIHPELVVNHDGANLWLSLPRTVNPYADEPLDRPHPEAPPVLIVPNALHVPVTNLDWAPSDEELEYRADPDHLSPEQRTILDAMVALFNAVDKVRVVGRAYAQHSIDDDPELLALVREARPGYMPAGTTDAAAAARDAADSAPAADPAGAADSAGSTPRPVAAVPPPPDGSSTRPAPTPRDRWQGEGSPAHTVVTSRLRSEMGEGDEGPIGFFMPMIDMLNHHPYGSRYERTKDGDWLIRAHHPKADSDQIYVRYNKADALGVALGLGYFEADARFVSSVACEFELPELGTVRVAGVSQQRRRLPVPRVVRTESGLRVGGVVLEPGRESALRAFLAMPLQSILASAQAQLGVESSPVPSGLTPAPTDPSPAPSASELAATMVSSIVAANIAYYQRLADFCADTGSGPGARDDADTATRGAPGGDPGTVSDTDPDPDERSLRPLFAAVAARQLQLLAQYQL